MNTVKNAGIKLAALTALLTMAASASAATVWTGPWVEFSKTGDDDPADPANQDQLTELVSLTRGTNAGLYNILQEEGFQRFQDVSPAGTAWAFQGLNGNPDSDVSAAEYESLVFTDFANALGLQQVGRNILDRPGVVHLIEEDIYLDILFSEWGSQDAGANVTYQRTSVVPLPAAAWMLGSALGLLGFVGRRPRP